jgi:hypothetical protein
VTTTRQLAFWPELLRRVGAAGCAALMLLLVTLAASPDLHERFHGASKVGNDEGCAVGLFANGVSLTGNTLAIPAPQSGWTERVFPSVADLFLVASRYLRQPERGPPLS